MAGSTDQTFTHLPPDLPAPVDDGACDHLPGRRMPQLSLPATTGGHVDLAQLPAERTVLYCYPRTGVPGEALPDGWDAIPGARGCTPQSCSFRDHHAELGRLGAEVVGLSTQSAAYQKEMAERLHLPFPVLSDARLELTRALDLPIFEAAGMILIRRLTLVIRAGTIEHVFYPVFPPDAATGLVLAWLTAHPARDS